jgi:hypothetical protein
MFGTAGDEAAPLTLSRRRRLTAPVLLVVDDAQWLDCPTSDMLAFVARRIEYNPIVLRGPRLCGSVGSCDRRVRAAAPGGTGPAAGGRCCAVSARQRSLSALCPACRFSGGGGGAAANGGATWESAEAVDPVLGYGRAPRRVGRGDSRGPRKRDVSPRSLPNRSGKPQPNRPVRTSRWRSHRSARCSLRSVAAAT